MIALLVTLSLVAVHVVLTWGYVRWPFDDYAVWLHQIERFANGGAPYADVGWHFPPLAGWLFGGAGRLLGTDLNSVWLATSFVYLLLGVAFAWWVTNLVPASWTGAAAFTVFLVALPFTSVQSAPIGMGMYTPAAPLGILWTLLLGASLVRYHRSPGRGLAVAIGLLSAACLLTKQDFWPPAVVAFGVASMVAISGGRRGDALATSVALALPLFVSAVEIARVSGPEVLLQIPGGFGFAEVFGIGRMLPTWERVVLEGATASLAISAVFAASYAAGVDRATARRVGIPAIVAFVVLAGGFWAIGKQIGYSWPRMELQLGLQAHAVSLFLPVFAGGLLWANRKGPMSAGELRLLVAMLAFLLAARTRRGFERVEGYHIMLELPVYLAIAHALWRDQAAKIALTLAPLVVAFGLYSYHTLESGPLTRGGVLPVVETPRGPARFEEGVNFDAIKDAVDRAASDPLTPVFSFGHNGGFAYFFDRPNPVPTSFGFQIGRWDPEELVRQLIATPELVVVYTPVYEGLEVPVPSLSPFTWSQPGRLNHYMVLDYPLFRRVIADCELEATVSRFGAPHYEVYAC